MFDMIAEGDVAASLKEVFQTPFLDTSIEEDGDIYVSGGLAFPIWIKVDQERFSIKFFTYMKLDDVLKSAEVLSAVNDLNHELVVVRFSLNPKQEAVIVDGDHFINFRGGLSTKTLAASAQKFASTFKFGFDKLVKALREASEPDQSVDEEAEGQDETEEVGKEPNIQALAAFLPTVTDPAFKPGEVVSPPRGDDGVMQMPFVSYGEAVHAFLKTAYAEGWVLSNFSWPDWAGTEEAARLRDDPATLAGATPEQLMRLLTVCIRQDRFVDGALLDAFESGLIRRVVQRAADLVGRQDA